MIKTKQYTRKPFNVDAIQVTAENMADVAAWCMGEIRQVTQKGTNRSTDYILVRVLRPLTPRQTQAFVGDWILYAGTGYKVYPNEAFLKNFDPYPTPLELDKVWKD